MYINPKMSLHVYRFKNEYLIAERLVIADRLVIAIMLVRRSINTAEYKMVGFSAGSELKRAQTPIWTTLLLG